MSDQLNNYAKYTGIAFEMTAIIALGVWGGISLDKHTSLKFPLFTVICSLAGVAIALYIAVKDFLFINKKKDK